MHYDAIKSLFYDFCFENGVIRIASVASLKAVILECYKWYTIANNCQRTQKILTTLEKTKRAFS